MGQGFKFEFYFFLLYVWASISKSIKHQQTATAKYT